MLETIGSLWWVFLITTPTLAFYMFWHLLPQAKYVTRGLIIFGRTKEVYEVTRDTRQRMKDKGESATTAAMAVGKKRYIGEDDDKPSANEEPKSVLDSAKGGAVDLAKGFLMDKLKALAAMGLLILSGILLLTSIVVNVIGWFS